jgi:DNA-binding response OmpR family regulator
MSKHRLLLVEDDRAMAIGLSFNLRDEGYEVVHCADGESGLAEALAGEFDLVVLDMMLPGISGLEVLEKLRAQDVRTPVLILSALSGSEKVVEGLNRGADDYLGKPFDLEILLARVRSLIRSRSWLTGRSEDDGDGRILSFGNCRVDFRHLTLRTPAGEQPLSYKEGMLLRRLSERSGEVVARDELLREVWGYTGDVQTRTIDQFVLALRKKIEPEPKHPRHLLTVPGQGYRFLRD